MVRQFHKMNSEIIYQVNNFCQTESRTWLIFFFLWIITMALLINRVEMCKRLKSPSKQARTRNKDIYTRRRDAKRMKQKEAKALKQYERELEGWCKTKINYIEVIYINFLKGLFFFILYPISVYKKYRRWKIGREKKYLKRKTKTQ